MPNVCTCFLLHLYNVKSIRLYRNIGILSDVISDWTLDVIVPVAADLTVTQIHGLQESQSLQMELIYCYVWVCRAWFTNSIKLRWSWYWSTRRSRRRHSSWKSLTRLRAHRARWSSSTTSNCLILACQSSTFEPTPTTFFCHTPKLEAEIQMMGWYNTVCLCNSTCDFCLLLESSTVNVATFCAHQNHNVTSDNPGLKRKVQCAMAHSHITAWHTWSSTA